jgi:hypothetical protein
LRLTPVPVAVQVTVYDFPDSTDKGALLKAMVANADEASMATEIIDLNIILTVAAVCWRSG